MAAIQWNQESTLLHQPAHNLIGKGRFGVPDIQYDTLEELRQHHMMVFDLIMSSSFSPYRNKRVQSPFNMGIHARFSVFVLVEHNQGSPRAE